MGTLAAIVLPKRWAISLPRTLGLLTDLSSGVNDLDYNFPEGFPGAGCGGSAEITGDDVSLACFGFSDHRIRTSYHSPEIG